MEGTAEEAAIGGYGYFSLDEIMAAVIIKLASYINLMAVKHLGNRIGKNETSWH
jgi:hypothetical protein